MSPSKAPYEILCIGAPICDYVLRVSDEYLDSVPGTKEGMQQIDRETLDRLIQGSGATPTLVAGGSGANTTKGLARLGHSTALWGCIGTDAAADYARKSLRAYGVTELLRTSTTPTTQVLCLVSPSGARTFRTYLGASREVSTADLHPTLFEGVKLVHIEGYAITYDGILERAMQLAKAAGATISYDVGSHDLVMAHQNRILGLLQQFVDVVFCNRDEISALLNQDPESGCARLLQLCKVAVVLLGKDGCIVGSGTGQRSWPAYEANILDTTGAGDLFASGFLHGRLMGASLEDCVRYGSLLGCSVIQVVGAEIPEPTWRRIREQGLIPLPIAPTS